MTNYFKSFVADEDGAITVDWVVLTAVMVALAMLILGIVETASVAGVEGMWADVDASIP